MTELHQQVSYILELDKLKAIQRKTLVQADGNRQENSAEHSWHISLLAQVMQQYASEAIDIQRVTSMLLIHDIVEIDAGDLFAFADEEELAAQELKELQGAQRIFGLLPAAQFATTKALWLEFEQAQSADARFAKAMDRVLPVLQNMDNNGGSWALHGVHKQQVLARNAYLQTLAPQLWDYVCQQVELAVQKGWLLP